MKSVSKILISLGLGLILVFVGIASGGLEKFSLNGILDLDIRFEASSIDNQNMSFENLQELDVDVSNVHINIYEAETSQQIQVKASHLYKGFSMYQEGQCLKIKQPQYWWKKNNKYIGQIDIYVPKGYIFNDVDIEAGFGQSSIEGLNANRLSVDSGFGQFYFNQITCRKFNLENGLGEINGKNIKCQNQLKVDTGLGSVDLRLLQQDNQYDYKVDVGLGTVQLGQNSFSGIADQTSYQGYSLMIDVDCGMGNVDIKMEG